VPVGIQVRRQERALVLIGADDQQRVLSRWLLTCCKRMSSHTHRPLTTQRNFSHKLRLARHDAPNRLALSSG
jgi:hypothetical protein